MALQMERWAGSKLGEQAHFLMVCVDELPERTARQFVSEYNLQHVQIGYCGSQREYPTFPGQLGCGGLVIFDRDGRIAVAKTSSFNEIGVKAWFQADCTIATLCDEDDEGDDEADVALRLYRDMNSLRRDMNNGYVSALKGRDDVRADSKGKNDRVESEEKKALGSVPSVGHDLMDEEHEHCAALFQQLDKSPSVNVFEQLVKEIESHFDDEEKLLKSTGFGSGQPEGMSPLITHSQDHRRIVKAAYDMLENVRVKGDDEVIRSNTKELAELFETHATEHDSRYVEYLATF
ncbi:hypothetical protein TrVE_jg5947 [Triparma verrucosa]|uniref:Hemerythrin-like domain-containing protein n=1 Tax=Triparma verrucosa TaxID=1606542 RepID=A0A9W7EUK6_9STRA|nr:hypothetical protein TrVE_jg5947 [Triparma verrucosa]